MRVGPVSVVLPTVGRVEALQEGLASIAGQSVLPEQLWLIVDAYDTAFVDRLGLDRLPFRAEVLFTGGGQGACRARNLGIARVDTPYVAFIDDDDAWAPAKLERQLEAMHVTRAVLSYTARRIRYDSRKKTLVRGRRAFKEPPADPARVIFRENFVGTLSSVMVRSDALVAVRGFDESMPAMQDYDLYIRLCQEGRVTACRQELTEYSVGAPGSQISSNLQAYVYAAARLREKYSGSKHLSNPWQRRRFHAKLMESVARAAAASGPAAALPWVWKSFCSAPRPAVLKHLFRLGH